MNARTHKKYFQQPENNMQVRILYLFKLFKNGKGKPLEKNFQSTEN